MTEFIDSFVQLMTSYLQQFGLPFGMGIIILESIIPVLPLGVFIAFNMMAFGNIVGFLISWIATCAGCILSYFIFNKFSNFALKKIKGNKKIEKVINQIQDMDFSKLVLIIALPFTPAFLVNIACGFTNMKLKKYITAILVGKLSIVYFWGFVGRSLLESITDIKTVSIVVLLLLASYIISKIVSKKMKIE